MELLQGSIDNLGYELYTDYSGRCMYGSKCFGFSTRQAGGEMQLVSDMLSYVVETDGNVRELMDLISYMANEARSDSMGMGTIYYYPNLQWDDGDYEDDGE